MKIRQLQLKNIGPFDDETIEFKACPAKNKAEIHILTGQNGSGKSTILQVIAAMFDDVEERTGFDFKHIPVVSPLVRKPTVSALKVRQTRGSGASSMRD